MPGCAKSIVIVVRLARPGGLRFVVAEPLLIKHQLGILRLQPRLWIS